MDTQEIMFLKLSESLAMLALELRGLRQEREAMQCQNLATKHDLRAVEHRLLAAIKDPASINLEALTAQLKAGTDSLEASVEKANKPL